MPCQDAHQALPSMTGPQALQEARRVLGQGLASRGSWPRSTGARVPQTGKESQPGQLRPLASRPVLGVLETVASEASLRQVCGSRTHYGCICPRLVPSAQTPRLGRAPHPDPGLPGQDSMVGWRPQKPQPCLLDKGRGIGTLGGGAQGLWRGAAQAPEPNADFTVEQSPPRVTREVP